MTGAGVTIQGLPELQAKVSRITATSPVMLLTAVRAGALVVFNDAKELAPWEYGTLSRSIHMETAVASATMAAVEVGTDLVYAAAQEFGFGNYAGKPYLRPALDENTARILETINLALAKLMAT